MYVWCQDKWMPLTPGLLWKLKNKRFWKKIMLVQENSSFEALQWLSWLECTLKDSNGKNVTLHHAYFRGEKQVNKWKVDGYACIDGVNNYFEYHG